MASIVLSNEFKVFFLVSILEMLLLGSKIVIIFVEVVLQNLIKASNQSHVHINLNILLLEIFNNICVEMNAFFLNQFFK